MNTPDKIYIYRETSKDYFDGEWGTSEVSDVECTAYIRKDALLEWAKVRKVAIETNGEEDDAHTSGYYACINAMIDKLNSL